MRFFSLCKRVTAAVLLASFVTILISINGDIFNRFEKTKVVQHHRQNTSSSEVSSLLSSRTYGSKFIVNTEGCKIPRTPIMPEYFKTRWHVHKIPDCGYERKLAELKDVDQTIHLLPEYSNSSCCILEVFHVERNDSTYRLSTCAPLNNFVDVSDKEMMVVKCDKRLNFEANIPIKPVVQEKIDFWKNTPILDTPLSVLFLGIDSVSRSHAYRSLPKTVSLMKQMGFTDFSGYHSVAASTLSNFMAFLMGLERKQVRQKCAPDWKSPFDACPFIWKDFGLNNYVTMYLEDGSQTFNWGDQSGFDYEPTDYYLHPLFSAMNDLRLKHSGIKNTPKEVDKYVQCSSSETVPQFNLRYTKRFVHKFQKTPFFAFTWFGNPFHDYMYSLANFDTDMLKFFESLKPLTGFLERTLIVLVSDHGDRTSFFQSKTIDAFIERGLPPLFIRFPENLKKAHPELDLENVLEENMKSLLSPFDLHHTFLHIMALRGLNPGNTSASEFEPIWADRSSILVPIDSVRNCEKLNIESGNCVCDTDAEVEHIKNPFYLTKIIDYVGRRLNLIVKTSKYKKVCAVWTTRVDWILSTRILHKAKEYTDILLQFSADPGSAHFEAKVRIIHEKSTFDGCKLISNFSRINRYREQSLCVRFETDADKEMKQFCMCKSKITGRRT